MKNKLDFNFLFFFEIPFLLIWFIIQYTFYYFTIIIFFITVLVYLILPTNHNIFIIYKLLWLVKNLMRTVFKIKFQLISKPNPSVAGNNNFNIENINQFLEQNKTHIVYTQIKSLFDFLLLFQLMDNNKFYINFQNKNNFHKIEKKIIYFIEKLQLKSTIKEDKIQIRVIICNEIPNDSFFNNQHQKNKTFFVLISEKNKIGLFSSKNKIYTV